MEDQNAVHSDRKVLPQKPTQWSTPDDRALPSPFPHANDLTDTDDDSSATKSVLSIEKFVLSIDGGGIRGYSSLVILQALMEEVGKIERARNPKATSSIFSSVLGPLDDEICAAPTPNAMPKSEYWPCHYFDYIAGTGTGGVIAMMLGRYRMSVPEAMERYRDMYATVVKQQPVSPLPKHRLRKSVFLSIHKGLRRSNPPAMKLVPNFPSPNEDQVHLQSDPNRCRTIVCGCGAKLQPFRSYAKSSPPRFVNDILVQCVDAERSRESYCNAKHFYSNPSRTVLAMVSGTVRKEISHTLLEELSGTVRKEISRTLLEKISGMVQKEVFRMTRKGVSPTILDEGSRTVREEISHTLLEEIFGMVQKEVYRVMRKGVSPTLVKEISRTVLEEISGIVQKEVSCMMREEVSCTMLDRVSRTIRDTISHTLVKEISRTMLEDIYSLPNHDFSGKDGIHLLSIGGAITQPVDPRADKLQHQMSTQIQRVHEEQLTSSRYLNPAHYCRLDVSGTDLQDIGANGREPESPDHRTFGRIEASTNTYLQAQVTADNLHNFAAALVDGRRLRARTLQWERWALGVVYRCPEPGCEAWGERFADRLGFWTHMLMAHGARHAYYDPATRKECEAMGRTREGKVDTEIDCGEILDTGAKLKDLKERIAAAKRKRERDLRHLANKAVEGSLVEKWIRVGG